MPYTTVADLYSALPTLAGSGTRVSTVAIGQHISAVQALMDAKLATRFTLPFSETPALLHAIATDLTLYRLFGQQVFTGSKDENEGWLNRFKEAGVLLCGIVDGDLSLVSSDGTVIPTAPVAAGTVWSSTANELPTMTEGDWYTMTSPGSCYGG